VLVETCTTSLEAEKKSHWKFFCVSQMGISASYLKFAPPKKKDIKHIALYHHGVWDWAGFESDF
jgi:hypothetical protein